MLYLLSMLVGYTYKDTFALHVISHRANNQGDSEGLIQRLKV